MLSQSAPDSTNPIHVKDRMGPPPFCSKVSAPMTGAGP
jgi:hypothetical protein